MPHRSDQHIGFQVDLARQVERPETLATILDLAAEMGYNACYLYGEGGFGFTSHPEVSVPWAITPQDYRDLVARAAGLGMQVIPVIPLLGHAAYILKSDKHKHLGEIQEGVRRVLQVSPNFQLCPTHPGTLRLAADLIGEWSVLTEAPWIHVGGDEAWHFALCPRCRERAGDLGRGGLLAEYFNRLNAIVKACGKRMMLWQDMLFYYPDALARLDRDIVICDWHYKPVERHPEIAIYHHRKVPFSRLLEEAGFEVVQCPKAKYDYETESRNCQTTLEYNRGRRVSGFLNTTWCMADIPFYSCLPSLAYGARAAAAGRGIDPGRFLEDFARQHYAAGAELLPLLVACFREAVEHPAFTSLAQWTDYQEPARELLLAARMEAAGASLRHLAPATKTGRLYRETLELLFARAALHARLKGAVNAAARGESTPPESLAALEALEEPLERQRKAERAAWDRTRPPLQPCREELRLQQAAEELRALQEELRALERGTRRREQVFRPVLELSLINNDCAFQELTFLTAREPGAWTDRGTFPQCGPFGAYVVTVPLEEIPRFVRFRLTGLGQLLLLHARIATPQGGIAPRAVAGMQGAVADPGNLLRDDRRAAVLGSLDNEALFAGGRSQPECSLDLEFEEPRPA